MAEKRGPSPTSEDIERMAEVFDDKDKTGRLITSQEDFDKQYNKYFKANPVILADPAIRFQVARRLNEMRKDHGYVTWPVGVSVTEKKKPDFNYLGSSKGRTVYLRAETYKIKDKTYTRYRDVKGRFGKVKE